MGLVLQFFCSAIKFQNIQNCTETYIRTVIIIELKWIFFCVYSDGNGNALQYWHLMDRIVQQVCLQTKEGDPDVAPVELDVKKIVKQLVI